MAPKHICLVDKKPIEKGPAYASRDKQGFLCEKHRNQEEKPFKPGGDNK